MKKVWVIKQKRGQWVGNEWVDVPWVYGKKDAAITEAHVSPEWLMQYGYNSEGAAVRQISRLPWWKNQPCSSHGAAVVEAVVPDRKLHYKIYRCYEIVILDDEDNQIGESGYCYGSRKDAELTAQHELKMTLMDQMYREGC